MTLRTQIIVIAIAVLAIVLTFVCIKKALLGFKITIPWLIVFVLVITFAAAPVLMDKLSHLIGIYDPVNMIFLLSIIFLMLIIYSLTVAVYDNKKKTRDLIQKVAYLEDRLEKKIDDKE